MKEQNHELVGEEKAKYLNRLDKALQTLSSSISRESKQGVHSLQEFGEQNEWDWDRLPKNKTTYRMLSHCVQSVREQYQLLDWLYFENDPSKNRGYCEKITVYAETGLPWAFDLLATRTWKKNAKSLLDKYPSFVEIKNQMKAILLEDYVKTDDVKEEIRKLRKSAEERNFLEQIQDALLIDGSSPKTLYPKATKVRDLGGEVLWNISFSTFRTGSGLFHSYIMDLWQDNIEEPKIMEDGPNVLLSADLLKGLHFHENNAAWYILKTIDDKFKGLHPVHVSRAIIGPFENRYRTNFSEINPLDITPSLLRENENAGLLRFNRQYSYAPNDEEKNGEIRQILYTDNWHDEIIVCPARYSSKVAKSVLGTNVKIFEM